MGEPKRKICKKDRYDDQEFQCGRITYLAHAKGYVMVRRPGCVPFVMYEEAWLSLATSPRDAFASILAESRAEKPTVY